MMYRPTSKWSWFFVLTALIQACVVLAFECYVFATFQTDLRGDASSTTQARTIPTFLTLYIFGFVYQLVLVWDALRLKNTIQVIGLVIYNIGLLIYGAVQQEQIKEAVEQLNARDDIDMEIWYHARPFLIAIPGILGLGTVALAVGAWKLYDEFAWTIYKHISADLRMKRRYLTYQVYIALLKFDFFFFLGFTIQFVVIVIDKEKKIEFALTIAAIPVTILILLAAALFCRRENLVGTIGVIVLYFGGLGYFCFKMVRMYSYERGQAYLPARKELTSFAALAILCILLTIINAIMCAANYKKGLKPYLVRRKVTSPDMKPLDIAYGEYPMEGSSDGKGPSVRPTQRMEID